MTVRLSWQRRPFAGRGVRLLALVAAIGLAGGSGWVIAGRQPASASLPVVAPAAPAALAASAGAPATSAVPVLAYYYLWFDPSSWARAKTDYPLLGKYSSDDPRVMRSHIDVAKSAGINGFIVSWKSTNTNNRRLRLLMSVAREANFSLAIIYQGLDFNRKPLPATRIASDFAVFRDNFSDDPVFIRLGGKPLTIWSGTWAFSHADIAAVTRSVRASLLVLATERNVEGYRRVADVTDGDAYYWSSVNPATNGYYGDKLKDMSDAVHGDGKYWIAPFAPGFDARLVGGTKEVPRRDGATLRTEYATAIDSSPDLLGLISWNEFSENSHVEPSEKYLTKYIDVLRGLRHATPVVAPAAMDSSDSSAVGQDHTRWYWTNLSLVVGFPLVLAGLTLATIRQRRRSFRAGTPPPANEG